MKVGIIDYGVGNLGSVARALEALRATPVLIERPVDMHLNDCLILPGVGSFTDCARLLDQGGWTDAIKQEVRAFSRPLLGICVGMQLLADFGTEGAIDGDPRGTPGLGFVPGSVDHLSTLGCTLRLPHVGWNEITRGETPDNLFDGISDGTDFYFTHSYAFAATDPSDVIATTDYGVPVTVAVRRGHVWGTQFHPEKSSRAGFRLLANFLAGPQC
ncbi:imidazole glycerol phosphate synthase subunit HisH [Sphingomonas sp. Leaf343]|uniref:imidazole glycerol phosphate synthase subunit HisH n=1 Tax=Sphingomonas sp. Leaf343 TaxID=1736345 RepID=UPI0006FEAA19|nr:imidazole glycerol phosphate synthase subunit HisH [Sphingomonas sp. Leaf343]KQR80232.1 imidazole glycerol phosphate synthase subunit HisH [Sphingomonas sp. Leaf343]